MVQIPNVSCMNAQAAQQVIEKAGFKFSGSFVSNPGYLNGTVFKTDPLPGLAPKGSEVTAFVSTGPAPGGRASLNQCLLILQTFFPPQYYQIAPSPTH